MCINRRAAHWYNEAQHESLAPAYAMAMRISGEVFCFRHRRMNRPPEARRNRFQGGGKVLIESKLVACDPFNLLRGDGAVNGTMIRMEIECGKNTAAVAHILKHKGFPAADGIHSQAIPGGHGWPHRRIRPSRRIRGSRTSGWLRPRGSLTAVFNIFCKRANCDAQMIPGA